MTPPRLLFDHDFNETIITGLVRREPLIDLLRVRDLGLQRVNDDLVLGQAAADMRVVISHDVSTMTAAAIARIVARQAMNGLIIVPRLETIGRMIDDLHLVWSLMDATEFVDSIRYLPL